MLPEDILAAEDAEGLHSQADVEDGAHLQVLEEWNLAYVHSVHRVQQFFDELRRQMLQHVRAVHRVEHRRTPRERFAQIMPHHLPTRQQIAIGPLRKIHTAATHIKAGISLGRCLNLRHDGSEANSVSVRNPKTRPPSL